LTNHLEDGGRREAREAIRAARAGSISMPQMLSSVLAAHVIVPLAEPPVMDGARMLSWKPATVSRDADGAQFVVVFTDEELDVKYAKWRPEYAYRLRVGADWLINVLPAGHGIVFNLGGGDILFEWPEAGILAYRADQQP
jgi:type III secretion system (T3SS) SseB-like protein